MKTLFFGVTLWLCGAFLASGEEVSARPISGAVPLTLYNQALVLALDNQTSAAIQAAKPPGFTEWNAKLDRAKAKRSSGKKLVFIGTGAVALLSFAVVSSSGNVGLYEVGSAVGVAVTGYGGYRWYSAAEEISDLDREGRTRGYLTLAPARGRGIQAAVTWRF